jgi:alpha-tubulin suppressor-like RCC1 family protein
MGPLVIDEVLMRTSLLWLVVAVLSVGSACSVDNITFKGEDGGHTDAAVDSGIDAVVTPLAIVTSTAALTVTEGTTNTFTVTLSSAPPTAAGVLVSLASSDDTKLGLSPTALLFSMANWNTPHTVTLTGKQDPDAIDESVTVTLTSDDAPTVTVAVTVDDDDGLAVKVSPTTLDVTEGASAPLLAHLTAQPTSDVIVDVASDNTAVAAVTPATLTFTVGNWNIDQTVTVSGVPDVNVVTDTASIAFTSPALTNVAVPVQVVDKDQVSITPTTTSLNLNEGASTTFGVALTQQPAATTTVTVASSDVGAATAAPATLTFTTGNWNVAQIVTVDAPQDVDTANEAVSITLASAGLTTRTISVAVTDDDTQVIVAAPSTVNMTENGTTTVNVHLAFKPASDVVVAASTLATTVATAAPATLTFTATNYASDQVVTLMAPDDLDADPNSTTLHLESVATSLVTDVPVNVADDDHLTIVTSVPAVALTENGSATFSVHLGAQPPATVTVAVLSNDLGAATVAPTMLTFTTATWNIAQTVTVSGVQDVDLLDEAVTVTLTAPGLPVANVAAAVTDDDAQGIVLSAATATVTEGATGTVGVSLLFMPTSNVTVTVASADPTVATVAPATLTFTAANYATPQLITISGVLDADAVDGSTMVTLTSTGLTTRTVAVTITDIDHLGLEASAPSLTVNEGATGTIGVRLTAQPTATTTVTIATSDAGAATAAPTTLTFTTVNWHTFQNLTVTGVQDADAADESVTLTAASTGLTSLPIAVTVIDDEILGIVTDVTAVALAEGGTGTFQVRLAAQPAATTMVTASSGDAGAATVAPTTLSFTTANWNVYQTVTVTGVQDNDLADESVTLTLASSGFPNKLVTASVADDDTQVVVAAAAMVNVNEGATATVGVSLQYMPAGSVVVAVASADGTVASAAPGSLTFTAANYATPQLVTITGTQDPDAVNDATSLSLTSAGATPATVGVTVIDDDVLGIETSATMLTIGEAGSGTIGVRLTAQPTATTTVAIASNDVGAATVTASLSFTTANWNAYQNITVAGVQDPDAANESVTLTLSSAGMTSKTVMVTVIDDDTLGIVTSGAAVALGEAGTATFQVKLSAMPAASVAVAVGSSDTGAATVAPATLTFTTANYATFQTVTVTGVQDLDLADETVTIAVTSPGLTTQNVIASVTDDDTQVVQVSAGTLNTAEGGSATFGVTLRYIPTAPTTVTVASSNTAGATVSPATLVFDSSNYGTAQNVTVTGVQDPDAANAFATVSLTAPSATPGSVAVTVIDDEVLGIETSATAVAVGEGANAVLGVRLTAQPLASTTVTIASSDTGAATVTGSLTFTSANWNVYQNAVVFGVQDVDLANENLTLTLSAVGLTAKSVPVAVTDDDVQAIVVPATLTIAENGTSTLNAHLAFQPAADTTVMITSGNAAAAKVNTPSVTFTAANYATDQPVQISGVLDADSVDATVTITFASGFTTATTTVTVTDIGPRTLAYAVNPASYTINKLITPNTPTVTGGAPTTYSVAPALPAGLVLSTAGAITGTPTTVSAMTTYVVTASNAGGSASANLSIAVNIGDTVGLNGVIAAGIAHTCALINGGVWCWGQNQNGQLGNNSTVDSMVPVQVVGLGSGVQAIGAGYSHTCALVNGGVQCWGNGTSGQLGNNLGTNSLVPVQVQTLGAGVQAIAVGGNHACAIVNGGAWCWGWNVYGQVGNNSATMNIKIPVQVAGLAGNVLAIAAGGGHSCALVAGGTFQCWGQNTSGQLGNGSVTSSKVPVAVSVLASGGQAIVAGDAHTCAIVDGGAQCWGKNLKGQVGNNSTANQVVPTTVIGLTTGVQAIGAGGSHTCALVNGMVQCWGFNAVGQLGVNTTTDSLLPVPTLLPSAQAIALGTNHTCALVAGGVQCWGQNGNGQLGNNTIVDTKVPGPVIGIATGVQAIAAGGSHTCALVNGRGQCWGLNSSGQLGNNSTTESHVPVAALTPAGLQAMSAGGNHTCAIINGGAMCWGYNAEGALGNNSTTNSRVPVAVVGLGANVLAVSSGNDHTCALVKGGVQCWGSNAFGQLGNNSKVNSSVPVQVNGLTSGVIAISAGYDHTCAIADGGVVCWGWNGNGQLGDGTTVDKLVPVAVTGLPSGVTGIATGDSHTCALVNGSAQCWGANGFGQLGVNSTAPSSTPKVVTGLSTGVQAIGIGNVGESTCALVNGGVQCWGFNSSGQLGNNSTTNSLVPVAVSGLTSGVQAIAVGTFHVCALSGGAVSCWGQNGAGQLGNNSTTNSLVPVPVDPWAP